MTNADLIREIRKPGNINVPVIALNDVYHVLAQKGDLIRILSEMDPDEEAPWTFTCTHDDGTRTIDAAY